MNLFSAPLLSLALSLAIVPGARAISDPENLGQWEKPTKIGPDKECPGFLVNLGPTGARAILKESSFVVKHVFAGSPAEGRLRIDDEITGANGKPFGKHTFGKCYGMKPGDGYEGPVMDLGHAIEDSEGGDGLLALDVIRDGKPAKVEVRLEAIGRFSDTFPAKCAKSEKLAARAMDYLLEHPKQRCGIEIEDFNRNLAYDCIHTHTHESGYMGYRFATGAYTPVGRQGLSIIVHQLAGRPGSEDHVGRVTRGMVTAKTRLNDGHGDNALAWGWALLGIQLSGDAAATREVFDYNKAFINMARTHDGAFVIQPGRNLHEKAYYMSPRIHPTAAMVLALGTDHARLRIQGVKGKPGA